MTTQQSAAFINAQTTLVNIRLHTMLEENRQRERQGHSPAYVESDFEKLEEEAVSVIGHNTCISLFNSCID